MKSKNEDLRILDIKEVLTPAQVHQQFPVSEQVVDTVAGARQQIHRILHNQDDRLLVIVGPCSIHDPDAAMDYAQKLKQLRDQLDQQLMVVMRVYFEKPRTTVGWKGLINDPNLDNSFEINKGLSLARRLLNDINSLGMPAGTEFLDLITPQYIADLVSWGAIGARTTESQLHRELASGLSCPIGFKNGTDGTLTIAIDAVRAANRPHNFLSMTMEGKSAIFATSGNDDCHVILRGGREPNYDAKSVAVAAAGLQKAGLDARIMIDLSHANSRKQFQRQVDVGQDVAAQISAGDQRIMGAMIESHLVGGRQDVIPDRSLVYGQSITDGCLSWDDTMPLLELFAEAVEKRRQR
ncbi:MAG: 3-deoxy-7-phosphoheptulonate synthase AroG [Gammaproteobacteria bacterium]|nr:3-deoxy-7-phosphoheptulonate synthase AroG [Gammaproteobacteria bacterium]MDH5802036.1 3-deoxy-7-phosphoheptulonate synthase AroG [Gammaproteobacteria bacterium]